MARNSREDRARMGYLVKAEIQNRINEGKLDKYDYVFTTDTKELCIIDTNLNIVPVKSRLDIYPSESDANYQINLKSDTYVGMIVMIPTQENGIQPYVVNENEQHAFYVVPVSSQSSHAIIDYNLAINTPIKNIKATTEIVLGSLVDGHYNISGMYRICDNDETHRVATSPILFSIKRDRNTGVVYITELNPQRISVYAITNGDFVSDHYVLKSELDFAIQTYMDQHSDTYVEDYVENNEVTPDQINDLFTP